MLMSEVLDHVVHPTLIHLSQAVPRIHSIAACRLVTCTAHVESLGEYLSQIGGGPGRGIFQIEPATALDVLDRYLETRDALDEAVWELRTDQDLAFQLASNLSLGAAICRIKYWMSPDPLPDASDAVGMGAYWKKIYNTAGGSGDPDHFSDAYSDLYLGD